MAYTSIRIQKLIKCNCSSYNFPHDVGKGSCNERITSTPEFSPPKRGLARDLYDFITDLETEIERLTIEETTAISFLIDQFKKKLS
jgi:hypothetical protein